MTTTESTKPVTIAVSFCKNDGKALFGVKAGMPVGYALEQASILMKCVEWLMLNGTGKSVETDTAQYLNDMARALVDACHPAV
ncbi:DUF3077 domain-containing protein [Pseudomonas sp. GV071]|uniref:DUF3077 domain-containing protein n=1 Tax=Pseudomonas sp. GV071 TaxID=2135754 RepID=UPI000D3317D2|nr:DUF3077 domain-containing protein [Pseudomonas sp. GV071]PTQ73248.1 Protein of unknown function (DUF3077) [Pseudomonas sp. GV071]